MYIIDIRTEEKLMRLLPELHKLVDEQFYQGIATPLFTRVGDIRDYFMWSVVNCRTREDAVQIEERYSKYTGYFEGIGDKFYTGFFFGLGQILSLRFGITKMKDEAISYDDFVASMKDTLKYFSNEGLI